MTPREKRMLQMMILEIIDDIGIYGSNQAAAVIFETDNGVNYLIDYEIAETDPVEYAKTLSDKELEAYNKIDKTGLEIVNVVYGKNEQLDVMSLKELLYLAVDISEAEKLNKVLHVNLILKDMTPYQLAATLGVSHQFMYSMINGSSKIPESRKNEIAKILEFETSEFDRVPNENWSFKL